VTGCFGSGLKERIQPRQGATQDAPQELYPPEQIIAKLRLIEVAMGSGKTAQPACKEASISEQSYYRWRKEYGGLQHDQAKRFKEVASGNW